jgi:hypothetical protein
MHVAKKETHMCVRQVAQGTLVLSLLLATDDNQHTLRTISLRVPCAAKSPKADGWCGTALNVGPAMDDTVLLGAAVVVGGTVVFRSTSDCSVRRVSSKLLARLFRPNLVKGGSLRAVVMALLRPCSFVSIPSAD